MENKNHVSINSLEEKSNIKHIKYILNDNERFDNECFHISIFIMVSLKEKEKLLKANIWRVSQFGTISLI